MTDHLTEAVNGFLYDPSIRMDRALNEVEYLRCLEFQQIFRREYGQFPDEILFEKNPGYPGHTFIHMVARIGDTEVHTRNVFKITINVPETMARPIEGTITYRVGDKA